MAKKKIDIDKLSLEELRKLKVKLDTSHKECGSKKCSRCLADRHNFIGRVSNLTCGLIKDEVEKLVLKLEKEENQHPAPQNEELPEPPYDIDKLSFPQLLKLAEKVNDVQGKRAKSECGLRCSSCISDSDNYTGRVEGYPCLAIQREINVLIAEEVISGEKSIETLKEQKPQNCSCLNCKWIDSATLHKGYCFCLHWHNFTIEDGNCHAYESREEPVETC